MNEQTIIDKLFTHHFFAEKLLNKTETPFLSSDERYLLQGVYGVDDELSEVIAEKDEMKTLGELGDVLYYLSVAILSLERFKKDALADVHESYARQAKDKGEHPSMTLSPETFVILTAIKGNVKKFCFQQRVDLLPHIVNGLAVLAHTLEQSFGSDGIDLALAMNVFKLNRRYEGGFSTKKSAERKV